MITYSTQFPVNERFDQKAFVELVIKWNQGSKYGRFESLEWDGRSFSVMWEEPKKKLIIEELAHRNIVSSRFQNEEW